MRFALCAALLLLAGCVQVIPSAEVAQQVKACQTRGGVPHVVTMSNYNDAVRRVVCYGGAP